MVQDVEKAAESSKVLRFVSHSLAFRVVDLGKLRVMDPE